MTRVQSLVCTVRQAPADGGRWTRRHDSHAIDDTAPGQFENGPTPNPHHIKALVVSCPQLPKKRCSWRRCRGGRRWRSFGCLKAPASIFDYGRDGWSCRMDLSRAHGQLGADAAQPRAWSCWLAGEPKPCSRELTFMTARARCILAEPTRRRLGTAGTVTKRGTSRL